MRNEQYLYIRILCMVKMTFGALVMCAYRYDESVDAKVDFMRKISQLLISGGMSNNDNKSNYLKLLVDGEKKRASFNGFRHTRHIIFMCFAHTDKLNETHLGHSSS